MTSIGRSIDRSINGWMDARVSSFLLLLLLLQQEKSIALRAGGCRGFAHFDLTAKNGHALKQCLGVYSGCKWRGGVLRLKLANEHYTAKLERERAEVRERERERERNERMNASMNRLRICKDRLSINSRPKPSPPSRAARRTALVRSTPGPQSTSCTSVGTGRCEHRCVRKRRAFSA